MRRIALLCAVMSLCMTAAVAWGQTIVGHPATRHVSGSHRAAPHPKTRRSQRKAAPQADSERKPKKSKKDKTAATSSTSGNDRPTSTGSSGSGSDLPLFGDQQVEASADNNKAGLAEAFPFHGHINGMAHAIKIYVDPRNSATTVVAAIYHDSDGRPGSLLATGKLTSPKAGAWNAVPLSATHISGSKSYWIAIMGKGGVMYFRDRATGPCQSVNSRQTGLAGFPSAWTDGAEWRTCPVSAYVAGTATAVTSSAPTSTTATTTTPTTPTSTTPVPTLPVPPVNLLAPQISGTPTDGQTLTTDNGTWLNGPTSYGYQWEDCTTSGSSCANIAGATASTYTLRDGDIGHTIRVAVTGTTSGGSTTATSAQTGAVQPPPAPVNTAAPTISGTTTQGQALTATNGSWTGNPKSYSYQWRDCNGSGASCSDISGASSSSYTLTVADVGHTVRVVVTATNEDGSTSATSNPTATVAAPPPTVPSNTAPPQISGSAAQGQTLTATNGTWTGSPTSYSDQWQDCDSSGLTCSNIAGATAHTYVITSSDVGHRIVVVVTAANGAGSSSQASAATAAVTASSSTTNCAGTVGSQTPNTGNMDACGFPSPDTTGVPAGTSLTPMSGNITASTPGQVISGISLTNGTIKVTANNVTIENSSITTGNGQLNGTSAISIPSGVSGTVIKYVTMQGTNCQGGSLFAGVMNQGSDQLTMDHVYGNCIDDILHGSGTLSNSYSIDNANIPNDHYEPVADDGGNGALTIDHDTLLNTHDQTAAVFTQCTFGDISSLTIKNSLLGGGDFAVYGPTSDPCGSGTGPESVTNNRFTRLYYPDGGQYGAAAYFPSGTTWSGNVWDDSNAAVSAP